MSALIICFLLKHYHNQNNVIPEVLRPLVIKDQVSVFFKGSDLNHLESKLEHTFLKEPGINDLGFVMSYDIWPVTYSVSIVVCTTLVGLSHNLPIPGPPSLRPAAKYVSSKASGSQPWLSIRIT